MITNKLQLAFYMKADLMMNRGFMKYSVRERLYRLFSPDFIIAYLRCMRRYAYYSNERGGWTNRLLSAFYKNRFKRLGLKLGFSIGPNVFGYGLVIPHYGTIVVGPSNSVGNYAVLHTSTCITDNGKTIGDGLYLATGAKLTSKITLGTGVTVGANSVVNKDVLSDNCLVGGIPAKIIKDTPIWFERDGEKYSERVRKIEELKLRLFGNNQNVF